MQFCDVKFLVERGLQLFEHFPEPVFVVDFLDAPQRDMGNEVALVGFEAESADFGFDLRNQKLQLGRIFDTEPQRIWRVMASENPEFVDAQIEGGSLLCNGVECGDDAWDFVFRRFTDEAEGEMGKVVGLPNNLVVNGAAAQFRPQRIILRIKGNRKRNEGSFHS